MYKRQLYRYRFGKHRVDGSILHCTDAVVPEIFQGEDRTVNVKDEREKFIPLLFERNCNPYYVVFIMAVEHHF